MTPRLLIGLSVFGFGCAQSPTALQQLEASCDTAAECSDWNTAQRNSCKDEYRDQVTDAERVGCGRQLNEFTDCILERARCQAGVFTSGGCAAEQTSLNNCIAGGGNGSCGDGTCGPGESNANCPADCTTIGPRCGDGACNGSENNETCPADCTTAATCGDGTCNGSENNATCPADCTTAATCGDGTCNGTETNATCPADCPSAGPDTFGCISRCTQCAFDTGMPEQAQACSPLCNSAPAACVNCLADLISCEDGAACPCGD